MASPPHFSSTRGGIKKNPCTKTKKGRRRILTTGSEVKEAGAASCRWDTSAEKEGDLKEGGGAAGDLGLSRWWFSHRGGKWS